MRDGWVVADYVRMGLEALPAGTRVAFLTVTEGSNFRVPEDHARAFSRLMVDVLRMLDASAKSRGEPLSDRPRPYLAVREFQKRGAMHTHTLIAGWTRVDIEELRALIKAHGFGRIFNVKTYVVGQQGAAVTNLAAYMAKTFGQYLSKSGRDGDEWQRVVSTLPKGLRLVLHSSTWANGATLEGLRHARRPLSQRTGPLAQALDAISLRVDFERESRLEMDAAHKALRDAGLVRPLTRWAVEPPSRAG
jgi:hypothetical protein